MCACIARLGRPCVLIGDGPDLQRARSYATPNVRLLGYRDTATVVDHLERCKALVFAAEEDFGIVPVEAQAAGAPVIAFGRGGARETVVDGITGVFFAEQTEDSIIEAVQRFEASAQEFDPRLSRAQAERFAKARFQAEFGALVEREWSRFRAQAASVQRSR